MRLARKPSLSGAAALLALLSLAAGCDRGDRPQQLGQPAPAVAITDGQQSLNLQNLRGHVVLLNFWASWCAPCIAEMPSLIALQQQLPEVKVVAVAFDQDQASYQSYLRLHPLPLITVLDVDGKAHISFGTFRPPETYIIDKTGTIRRKFIGAQDWTSPEIIASLRKLASA